MLIHLVWPIVMIFSWTCFLEFKTARRAGCSSHRINNIQICHGFRVYHYQNYLTIVTAEVPTCVCVPGDGGECGGEHEARCSPGRHHPATGSRPPRPRLIASTGPRSEAAPGITLLQTLLAGSCIMLHACSQELRALSKCISMSWKIFSYMIWFKDILYCLSFAFMQHVVCHIKHNSRY